MKKIAIVLAFGFFGFVAFGETPSADSTQESSANSQVQQESQTQVNPSEQVDSQAQSDFKAQADSNGQADSQAVFNTQVDTSTQANTQQDIGQSVELKYPNSDWEVLSEIDTSEWSKKEAECNALEKGTQRDKCKSERAKKFHKLCKSKGDNKSCVLKVAMLTREEIKSEDIDILYKTCDKEYASACAFYGNVVGELGDKANEARLYEKACELGSAIGCLGMGKSHSEQAKDILKAKPYIDKYIDKAVDLADKGCKGDFEVACKQLENINKLKTEIAAKAQAQSQAQEANAGKKSKKSKK